MKSNSEPLEVHSPDLNPYSSSYVNYNYYRNYSDTDALLRKSLNRTANNNNNITDTDENASNKTGSLTENPAITNLEPESNVLTTATSYENTNSFLNSIPYAKQSKKTLPKSLHEIYNSTTTPKLDGKLGLYDILYNTYSNKTLVGNWFEDQAREDHHKQKCLEKECIYKNICLPKDFFERQASLSHYTFSNTVNYTDKIVFKIEKSTKCSANERLCDSFLQLDYYSEKPIDSIEYSSEYPAICHLCYKENNSMVFRIEAVERLLNDKKSEIRYGQHFYINTIEGGYYLYADTNLTKRTKHSKLSPVFFTKYESVNSNTNFKWMFVPLIGNAASIYEYEGKPVDTQKRFFIKHVNTDRYLIVCNQLQAHKNNKSSQFYEIACDSLIIKKYIYTQNNQWSILKA